MSDTYSVFARFTYANDIIDVVLGLRDAGFTKDEIEVFSPIPLEVEHLEHSDEVSLDEEEAHKLEETFVKKGRKVGFFTRFGAVLGISFSVTLVGLTPLEYPIEPAQQGGMPIVPFPPMGILSFEAMILFSFIASILGFAYLTKKQRDKGKIYDKLLTVDRYAIGLTDQSADRMAEAVEIFKQNHSEDIFQFTGDDEVPSQLSEDF